MDRVITVARLNLGQVPKGASQFMGEVVGGAMETILMALF